jgi:hypothetical protein
VRVVVLGRLGIEAVGVECAGGPLEQAASVSPIAEQQSRAGITLRGPREIRKSPNMGRPPFDYREFDPAALYAQQIGAAETFH